MSFPVFFSRYQYSRRKNRAERDAKERAHCGDFGEHRIEIARDRSSCTASAGYFLQSYRSELIGNDAVYFRIHPRLYTHVIRFPLESVQCLFGCRGRAEEGMRLRW